MEYLRDRARLFGKMVKNMLDHLRMTCLMAKVLGHIPMVETFWVMFLMVIFKAVEP